MVLVACHVVDSEGTCRADHRYLCDWNKCRWERWTQDGVQIMRPSVAQGRLTQGGRGGRMDAALQEALET